MKNKIVIAMGAMALVIALTAGISYAWFTDQAEALPTEVEAGYADISLTGQPNAKDSIFPAEEGKRIDYTITNVSSREVIVQFKAGALTAYVMPDRYLDSDGEYILKDKHAIMKGLKPDEKMNIKGGVSDFEKLERGDIPVTDVISDMVDDWILTGTGSKYLGKDNEGNQYFLLEREGTAKGTFEVALTEDAGNKYQYALFTIGEAVALATQHNDGAIAAAFQGLDINDLIK